MAHISKLMIHNKIKKYYLYSILFLFFFLAMAIVLIVMNACVVGYCVLGIICKMMKSNELNEEKMSEMLPKVFGLDPLILCSDNKNNINWKIK
jgi:hypothetical protein